MKPVRVNLETAQWMESQPLPVVAMWIEYLELEDMPPGSSPSRVFDSADIAEAIASTGVLPIERPAWICYWSLAAADAQVAQQDDRVANSGCVWETNADLSRAFVAVPLHSGLFKGPGWMKYSHRGWVIVEFEAAVNLVAQQMSLMVIGQQVNIGLEMLDVIMTVMQKSAVLARCSIAYSEHCDWWVIARDPAVAGFEEWASTLSEYFTSQVMEYNAKLSRRL